MESLLCALKLVAALGAGLMAGLFFAFSISVMRALGRLAPPAGIAAMQFINAAILNPLFLAVFFATAAACLLVAIAALPDWQAPGAAPLIAGGLIYLVGGFLVTIAFNVPLNERLAAVSPDSAEGAEVWARYLSVWTAWNHVRTLACLAAAALLTWARC